MTSIMANMLVDVQNPKFLFFSLWMHDPEQHKDYRKFGFLLSNNPLIIAPEMPPIPVMIDICTDRYLKGKKFEYSWESFIDESSRERRARIVKVRITPVADNSECIVEPWLSFKQKFLEFHRKPANYIESDDEAATETMNFSARRGVPADDIDAMDDDSDNSDENEEERPRRRRR